MRFRTTSVITLTLAALSMTCGFYAQAKPFSRFDAGYRSQNQSTDDGSLTYWTRIVPEGEEFSVVSPIPIRAYAEFHGHPLWLMHIGGQQIRQFFTYSTYADGLVFIIQSYKAAKPEHVLRDRVAKREFTAETLGKDVDIDGFKGKVFEVRKEDYNSNVCYVATKQHAYMFLVAGRDRAKVESAPFPASIKLGKREVLKQDPTVGQSLPSPFSHTTKADGAKIFDVKEVDHQARIIWKPQPLYNPEALTKHFNDRVVLQVVFLPSGKVTEITPVKELSNRLTNSAIEAAKLVRFLPAEKNGHFVSQRGTIIYPFLRN